MRLRRRAKRRGSYKTIADSNYGFSLIAAGFDGNPGIEVGLNVSDDRYFYALRLTEDDALRFANFIREHCDRSGNLTMQEVS